MNFGDFGTIELRMLWLSIALGVIQLVLAVLFSLSARGLPWGAGNRDDAAPAMSKMGARVERAFKNYLETFALFAAAVLMANAMGKHTAMSALGAEIYFWSRVAYVPVYAAGIPYVRTVLWIASIVGIGMVMRAVFPGM